jgi:TusE/DsrC/DsvC family sulfur relay protein
MSVTPDSFTHAPDDWDMDTARSVADKNDIDLTDDHWELIIALQEYYSKVEFVNLRQLKDALEEKFHSRGGMKFLYQILPGGPVAQGCQLAGLKMPAGAIDKSFGSAA